MKIWVVGSSGMLGKSIVSQLPHTACVFKTQSSDVDITRISDILGFVKGKDLTHIVNCAAYTDVDSAEKDEKKAYEINALGVKNLAEVSLNIGAKIIHFSTDYVFSGKQSHPYEEEDLREPKTVYGKSKLLGEQFLFSLAKDPCLIRTSWLFGLGRKNFVRTIIELIQKKEEISVVADQIGRPTFSLDLAKAAIDLLSSSGIYHFANDKVLSWYQFSEMILSLAKQYFPVRCKRILPITSKEYGALAQRPLYSVLSTKKIETFLKGKIFSLEESLKDYILKSTLEKLN